MSPPDRQDRPWPEWLAPFRLREGARHRLRRRILAAARPRLAERRREEVWDVTAGWARALVPLAAAAGLFLGWVLFSGPPPASTVVLEDTPAVEGGITDAPPTSLSADPEVRSFPAGELDPSGGLPALLTSSTAPDGDRVLQAVVYEGGR